MTVDFGTDLSCTTSLKTNVLVSGARLVAEALYRRLTTPRGMLRGGEEEADYGFDLEGIVGRASTLSDAAALPGRVRAEALKDERIVAVDVRVVRTVDGPMTTLAVTIVGQTDAGPFELRLAVSDVTTELLGLEAGG